MAAVIPAPEFRDKFVLIEKCWTNREVLFEDFGCGNSEFGYVYSNGAPDASPRFSIRIPNWTIEFMCDVVYCETGLSLKIQSLNMLNDKLNGNYV